MSTRTDSRAMQWFRSDDTRSVGVFFTYGFLLLVCYYVLKTLREPLLLVGSSAAIKSYANAAIAAILLLVVPLYSVVFRRMSRTRLSSWVTGFFVLTLASLLGLGQIVDIGVAYYVWVGVFGVMILAQFWAQVAESYDTVRGERVFPVIMAGATLGALVGPTIAGSLFPHLGAWPLMTFALLVLVATLPLIKTNSAPAQVEAPTKSESHNASPLGGLRLVFANRYLGLLALLIVLLNCINSTGEYILAELITSFAADAVSVNRALDEADVIARLYGDFYLAVNALAMLIQFVLVRWLIATFGVPRTLLLLPIAVIVGYGLIAFIPIFGIIRLVKIVEDAADYSLMNTTRHALFLPLSVSEKYEGKMTIDTFFWRLGDLIQAAVIFAGLNWFGMEYPHFALFNMLLAIGALFVAIEVGKHYVHKTTGTCPKRFKLRPLAHGLSASLAAGIVFVAILAIGSASIS